VHRGLASFAAGGDSLEAEWEDLYGPMEDSEAELSEVPLFEDAPPAERAALHRCVEEDDVAGIIRLAEMGMGCAQGHLGLRYKLGDGVSQNPKEAEVWMERGVQNNDLESMYQLGCFYYDGDQTGGDAAKARRLWKRAAYHGHLRACYKYGVFLYSGEGGPTHDVEARRMLTVASEGGVRHANMHLSRLWLFGVGGPADEDRALHYEELAMQNREVRHWAASARAPDEEKHEEDLTDDALPPLEAETPQAKKNIADKPWRKRQRRKPLSFKTIDDDLDVR
jgi:TPR repeat protein